jgi:hypothetical protein
VKLIKGRDGMVMVYYTGGKKNKTGVQKRSNIGAEIS